jgi:manganese/iron transport system permease protein
MSLFELLERGWEVLLRNYQWYIVRPLDIEIFVRAMQSSILIGIVSGVVGSLVVVRGLSFFGDALAHTVLPGVAYMYQRNQENNLPDLPGSLEKTVEDAPLFWGGLLAGIVSAFAIGFLTRNERVRSDSAIGVVFAGMFALGIAMISQIEGSAQDLTHILFGEIFGVSKADLRLTLIFSVGTLLTVVLFYKEFLVISFDKVLAQTLRLPTEFFRFLLLILIAITIVISLQIVGIALMLALLVTPAATASLITHRLHIMMLLAALIGSASSIIGFYVSYHMDVSMGPSIVLSATAIFLLVFIKQSVVRIADRLLQRVQDALAGSMRPSSDSSIASE